MKTAQAQVTVTFSFQIIQKITIFYVNEPKLTIFA